MTESSETASAGAASAPAWKLLGPDQRRVLGVLVEKAKTTPAGYPMTLNAIAVGCNQKNNRDPITQLTADEVETVLVELQNLGVVIESPEATRAVKYRHRAYEWFRVDRAELAVLTELLLRGPQSLGDLRARAARMEPIADLTALKPIVERLLARGLMIELTPAGRGQIVSHGVYTAPELAELKRTGGAVHAPAPESPASREGDGVGPPAGVADRTPRAGEIEALREEIARLRERIERLEAAARREV